MASHLVLGQPLRVGDQPNHDRAVVRNAVPVLAALKALLDTFLESDHRLFTIPVYRKHARHADQWNPSRDRAALNMAMAATHLISDIGGRIFWRLIEYANAQTNAVAKGTFRNRRRVGRGPGLCRVSRLPCIL